MAFSSNTKVAIILEFTTLRKGVGEYILYIQENESFDLGLYTYLKGISFS